MIPINGVKQWLWRAVDANGDTLDILVQGRRNTKAAKRFLTRLIAQFGLPRLVIFDKLCSYIKRIAHLAPDADHRAHKGLNNRIKGHRPTRPEGVKRSWGGSSRPGKRSVSLLHMTKSTPSSKLAAIVSPPVQEFLNFLSLPLRCSPTRPTDRAASKMGMQ